MTSGTLSVVAHLRFRHAKGRHAVVGEPRELARQDDPFAAYPIIHIKAKR
jgi:hypothetical protein